MKDELKHIDREIKKNTPELKKVWSIVTSFQSLILHQVETAYANLKEQIEALSAVINEAEDDIFSDFCRKIRVSNIREFEERQLKLSQEESDARLRFETQIARLTNQ